MRSPKVQIDFTRFTDSELDQRAQAIVAAMTGNAHFAAPVPALADITTTINNYQQALSQSAMGDYTSIEIKFQQRKLLENLLRQLGIYVEIQSDKDAATMLSSGFKIHKNPSPVGPLPKPTGFKVLPLGKGEMKLCLDKINKAKLYQFEYKPAASSQWMIQLSTRSRLLLTGLESGKEYDFRVVPVRTSDIREYSNKISSFVL